MKITINQTELFSNPEWEKVDKESLKSACKSQPELASELYALKCVRDEEPDDYLFPHHYISGSEMRLHKAGIEAAAKDIIESTSLTIEQRKEAAQHILEHLKTVSDASPDLMMGLMRCIDPPKFLTEASGTKSEAEIKKSAEDFDAIVELTKSIFKKPKSDTDECTRYNPKTDEFELTYSGEAGTWDDGFKSLDIDVFKSAFPGVKERKEGFRPTSAELKKINEEFSPKGKTWEADQLKVYPVVLFSHEIDSDGDHFMRKAATTTRRIGPGAPGISNHSRFNSNSVFSKLFDVDVVVVKFPG